MAKLNDASIHIENFSLSFNKNLCFDKLNVSFEEKKFTCILGPSGVGKSSLLRAIAGLYQNSKSLSLSGKIYCSKPLNSSIAYMAQSDLLFPWLNVLENTLLGLKLRKKINSKEESRAIHLLSIVGLSDVLKAYPQSLSGGMKQRVALVRTLMEDKPIILMDEPFSALDAISRLKLQSLSADLLKDRTVILVTHDPMEALRIGHCIYVLLGSPAYLSEPIYPSGESPRETNNPEILNYQGNLLTLLQNYN